MTPADLRRALSAPFPADEISWRVGSTNRKKWEEAKKRGENIPRKGQPLAYIDPRDVMGRLDDVMGFGWQCDYIPMPNGSYCCRIGLKIEGEWLWRANGAVNVAESDRAEAREMAEKAGYSDSFKRAAVLWGIGRYLYNTKAPWIELDEYWGIPDAAMERLRKLLTRNGAAATAPAARAQNDTAPTPASQIQEIEPMRPMPERVSIEKRDPLPSHVTAPAKDAKALALERQEAEMAKAAARAHDSTETRAQLISRLSELVPGAKDWDQKWSAYNLMARAQYSKLNISDKSVVVRAERKRQDQHRAELLATKSRQAENVCPETGEILPADEAA